MTSISPTTNSSWISSAATAAWNTASWAWNYLPSWNTAGSEPLSEKNVEIQSPFRLQNDSDLNRFIQDNIEKLPTRNKYVEKVDIAIPKSEPIQLKTEQGKRAWKLIEKWMPVIINSWNPKLRDAPQVAKEIWEKAYIHFIRDGYSQEEATELAWIALGRAVADYLGDVPETLQPQFNEETTAVVPFNRSPASGAFRTAAVGLLLTSFIPGAGAAEATYGGMFAGYAGSAVSGVVSTLGYLPTVLLGGLAVGAAAGLLVKAASSRMGRSWSPGTLAAATAAVFTVAATTNVPLISSLISPLISTGSERLLTAGALALGSYLGARGVKPPAITSAIGTEMEEGVIKEFTCGRHVFKDVKFQRPKGLTEEEKEIHVEIVKKQLIKIATACPNMGDGEKFQLFLNEGSNDSYTLHRDLKFAQPGVIPIIEIKADKVEEAEVEVMLEVFRGKKDISIQNTLHSIKTERIPFNQPTARPIAFSGGNSELNAALHSILSVGQLRHYMRTSNQKVLEEIASDYERLLKAGNGGSIDVSKLQAELTPLIGAAPDTSAAYYKAIMKLMKHGDAVRVTQATLTTRKTNTGQLRPAADPKREESEQIPVVDIPARGQEIPLQEALNAALLGPSEKQGEYRSTLFDAPPPVLQLHFGKTPDKTTIPPDGTLTLGKEFIDKAKKDETYVVKAFSVIDGGVEVNYMTTNEYVEKEQRFYYWKIDAAGHAERISHKTYQEAMNQPKSGLTLVRKGEVHPEMTRTFSPIQVAQISESRKILFERCDIKDRDPNPAQIDDKHFKNSPEDLQTTVAGILATPRRTKNITLPVKSMEAVGVMWFVAREEMRKQNRFDQIRLVLDPSVKITHEKLKRMLQEADAVHQNLVAKGGASPDLKQFMTDWKVRLKIPTATAAAG